MNRVQDTTTDVNEK